MKRGRKRKILSLFLILLGVIIIGGMAKSIDNLFQNKSEAVDIDIATDILESEDLLKQRIDEEVEKERYRKAEEERQNQLERLKEEERIREEKAKERQNSKVAYLTFDDGPSAKSTPLVLDILKEYNIKATFFVIGRNAEQNPKILKRIYEEGHNIGNHTYSHNMKYLYQNTDNFMNDIYKGEKVLKSILGKDFDSQIVRFPGGSFEKRKKTMRKAVEKAGYRYFDWNALNGDAEGVKKNPTQLLNRLKETTWNKNNIIVLMHDTDEKQSTVQFLRSGIEYLISQGYEFQILDKNY